jgi:hypothetical protein
MGYMQNLMQTVVETAHYAARVARILTEQERDRVISEIAANPLKGAIVKNTGGVRKVRVAIEGRGKSGGARVIYYYHDPHCPIFLLEIFAKNERADLSQAQRNEMAKVTATIKREARKGR